MVMQFRKDFFNSVEYEMKRVKESQLDYSKVREGIFTSGLQ